MKKKRLLSALTALLLVLCLSTTALAVDYKYLPYGTNKYQRNDDDLVYEMVLGSYDKLYQNATNNDDLDTRLALFAKAEAELLDSAVLMPTTTSGGRYAISRTVPHTISSVDWSRDGSRLHQLMVTTALIKTTDRDALIALWNQYRGTGKYETQAKKYLNEHGYTLKDSYNSQYSGNPNTWDGMATWTATDSDFIVQTYDGLMEYNNENIQKPALATSYDVSADGKTYTFHLRKNVKWVDYQGNEIGTVTADDFVAGLQHLLDAWEYGSGSLVAGTAFTILNADSYINGKIKDFSKVGVKAVDQYTLQYTLKEACPYFMTLLSYLEPLNRSFYLSKGGVFGYDKFQNAYSDGSISYGSTYKDIAYCGPYLVSSCTEYGDICFSANPSYWNKDKINIKTIKFRYVDQYPYTDVVSGEIDSTTLNSDGIASAKADGYFDSYAYISSTSSTTYFITLNVNRGTFEQNISGEVKSPKTTKEKIDAATALSNENFRKAILFAIDKAAYNGISVGDDLACTNLRNTYTPPQFSYLSKQVTVGGKTFAKGTSYGDMVQYYLNKLNSPIQVDDGVNGWYHPTEAKKALTKAKSELEGVSYPVKVDIVYYSNSTIRTDQTNALKNSIENVLGKNNVVINLIPADTTNGWLDAVYYPSTGSEFNSDILNISGWSADYGDPSTYLGTVSKSGYVTKEFGISDFDGKYDPVEFADTLPFTDVPKSASYYDKVLWAYKNGIVSGTSATTFSPEASCTRYQFCVMLYRLAGKPAPKTTTLPFTDVKDTDSFYKAVCWAYGEGIISGTSKTTFSPQTPITRYQVMAMLYKMAGKPEPKITENPFTDVSKKDSYYKAVLWGVGEKITSGTSSDKFSPKDPCKRYQLVVFLYKFNKIYNYK